MEKLIFSNQYFNIEDTLNCGQIFRFKPFKDGFMVNSLDKRVYCVQENDKVVLFCEDEDARYFANFFDIDRDYGVIYNSALKSGYEILKTSAQMGKGIRILNQDKVEMLFSFIISQNNNIPRIKSIIDKLCTSLGEKKTFMGEEFYSFPTLDVLSSQSLDFYKRIGLGYRAEYVLGLAKQLLNFDLDSLDKLPTYKLKQELLKIKGIGQKVCDCVALFGFHRSDSFPVDTWIEKVYKENFNGKLNDRKKITDWFLDTFKENSGYFQQYLFYYKRSKEREKG